MSIQKLKFKRKIAVAYKTVFTLSLQASQAIDRFRNRVLTSGSEISSQIAKEKTEITSKLVAQLADKTAASVEAEKLAVAAVHKAHIKKREQDSEKVSKLIKELSDI